MEWTSASVGWWGTGKTRMPDTRFAYILLTGHACPSQMLGSHPNPATYAKRAGQKCAAHSVATERIMERASVSDVVPSTSTVGGEARIENAPQFGS